MAVTYSEVDKSYAFVILFASFMSHVLQYGVVWTVGVFFAIFTEVFEDNNGVIALISSLNTAFYYGAGPLSSYLTNKYGPRMVAVIGGLVGSVGLVLSTYANNAYYLYATFGIIAGFGLGLAYIPSITVLGLYFYKYRSIAIGIAVSGCGVGTFVFPPLIRYFIHHYGWRGALLLIGGISLNLCVLGMLLRPFREKPTDIKSQYRNLNCNKYYSNNKLSSSICNSYSKLSPGLYDSNNKLSSSLYISNNSKLSKSLNTLHDTKCGEPLVVKNKLLESIKASDNGFADKNANILQSSDTHLHLVARNKFVDNLKLTEDTAIRPKSNHGSMLSIIDSRLHMSSVDAIESHSKQWKKKNSLNLFIFKNTEYVFLCLNNFTICFGLSIVYVHLAAYARTTAGIDTDSGALLFSAIGASNFCGRIAFGFLGHCHYINHTGLYAAAFFLSGLITAMCPIYSNYIWLMTFASSFGFLTGSFGSLLPMVIIRMLEVQYLTSSYGYLLIFEAMGTLLGAPTAGWLYMWTESYANSMYLGGCVIMVSAALMIYPWLQTTKCLNCKTDDRETNVRVQVTNDCDSCI